MLRQQYPFVQLATLKQREEKAKRRAGRLRAGAVPYRLVPRSDAQYVTQLEMMIATLRIALEHKSEKTGRTETGAPLGDHRPPCAHPAVRGGGGGGVRGREFFHPDYPAHFPAQLCHAHALRIYAAQGIAEHAGSQGHQDDGDLYAGICAGRDGEKQGAVSDAGGMKP